MCSTIERLRAARNPGFVFGGGSMRCVFQVGVIETLYALGIRPAACLGVSGGAWNAAAVAVGNWRRLRYYWRCFARMPHIDVRNLAREHSPFIWTSLHRRAFARYVGAERVAAPGTLPLFVALTRLRDKASVIVDVNTSADPFTVLLASNYLPPFYTHAPAIAGERYGDGGYADNTPYEALFDRGCDMVVLMSSKGESEGGLNRSVDDPEHVIPDAYRDRVIVIRPRHRMPLAFVERRWERLAPIADLGALRAREVLLGERHAQCDVTAKGRAPSWYFTAARRWILRQPKSPR